MKKSKENTTTTNKNTRELNSPTNIHQYKEPPPLKNEKKD